MNPAADPADVAALKARLAAAEAALAERDAALAAAEATVAEMADANRRLEQMIAEVRREKFGPRSEKLSEPPRAYRRAKPSEDHRPWTRRSARNRTRRSFVNAP